MIGSTISHYRILDKLGEGGMGIVYKAQDTRLERFVALKFLPQRLAEEPGAKQRFVNEAKAACAVNHPNVAVVYDVGETDVHSFIAMELVEGETLKSRSRLRSRLSDPTRRRRCDRRSSSCCRRIPPNGPPRPARS
jgi:serine/threonine protein kinase